MLFNKLFGWRVQETPAARREHLLQTGRIVYGSVLDWRTDETGAPTNIIFKYNVGGVDYESAYLLDATQSANGAHYIPGATIQIRYLRNNPTDAIVV